MDHQPPPSNVPLGKTGRRHYSCFRAWERGNGEYSACMSWWQLLSQPGIHLSFKKRGTAPFPNRFEHDTSMTIPQWVPSTGHNHDLLSPFFLPFFGSSQPDVLITHA